MTNASIYSVRVFDYDSQTYSTVFGLIDEANIADEFSGEEFKDFTILGEIPVTKIAAFSHCYCKDELKKRYPFEY